MVVFTLFADELESTGIARTVAEAYDVLGRNLAT